MMVIDNRSEEMKFYYYYCYYPVIRRLVKAEQNEQPSIIDASVLDLL